MVHFSLVTIISYYYKLLLFVIIFWWNHFIPSRNLDEVFTCNQMALIFAPFEAVLMLRHLMRGDHL